MSSQRPRLATSVSITLLNLWSSSRRTPGTAPKLLASAVLSLLLIAPQLLIGCRTQEHFFDITGWLFVLSAADHYAEAFDRAADWSPDPYLIGITVYPYASKGGDHEPLLRYQFDSHTGGGSLYSVEFDGEEWTSRATELGASAVRPPPIDRGNWSLDSVDAWSIALANGGEDFLFRYQDPMTAIILTLNYPGGAEDAGRLTWRVNFFIVFGPSLDMHIDPHTGDINDVEERSTSGTLVEPTPTLRPTP